MTRGEIVLDKAPGVNQNVPMKMSWRNVVLGIGLLFLLGYVVYSPTVDAGFYLDDVHTLVQNKWIRSWDGFWRLRFRARMLTDATFLLNNQWWGMSPPAFRLFNIGLHGVSAAAVWLFAVVTLSTPRGRKSILYPKRWFWGFLTALVFLLHPIQTQAVAYVVQRYAVLATLFYVTSLTLFSLALQKRTQPMLFGISGGLLVLGLMSKETAFTLPFMAFGYTWFFFPETVMPLLRRYWKAGAAIVVGLIFLILDYYPLTYIFGAKVSPSGELIGVGTYLLTQFPVMVTYLRLLILPVHQIFDYAYPLSRSLFEPRVLGSLGLLLALVYLAWKKRGAYIWMSFFGLWFVVSLFIESSFFPLGDVIFEHRLYLPMVGFSLAFVFTLAERRLAWVIGVALIALTTLTLMRARVLSSPLSIWRDTIQKAPHNSRAYGNYGYLMVEAGNLAEGEQAFLKAYELAKPSSIGLNNLGVVALRQGKLSQASEYFSRALQLNPRSPEALDGMASVLTEQGDASGAAEMWKRTIELEHGSVTIYLNTGTVLMTEEQYDAALTQFERAMLLEPTNARIYNNIGSVWGQKGDFVRAEAYFRRALQLDPTLDSAKGNLLQIQKLSQ